jgi:hypothetical protein
MINDIVVGDSTSRCATIEGVKTTKEMGWCDYENMWELHRLEQWAGDDTEHRWHVIPKSLYPQPAGEHGCYYSNLRLEVGHEKEPRYMGGWRNSTLLFKLSYQHTYPFSNKYEVAGARLEMILADMGKKEWTIVIYPTLYDLTDNQSIVYDFPSDRSIATKPTCFYNNDWHDQGHLQVSIEADKLHRGLERGCISDLILEQAFGATMNIHGCTPLPVTLARLDKMLVNPTFPSLIESLGGQFHHPLMGF